MRVLSRLSAALFAVALMAAPASAQVNFQFTTTGCFFVGAGTCTGAAEATHVGLKFTGATVIGTSNASGVLTLGNLGTFSMANTQTTTTYTGVNFMLYLTFTAPSATDPNPGTFDAVLSGTINGNNNSGTVDINFDNLPEGFTYSGGTFTVTVNDVTGLKGQGGNANKTLTGKIQVAPSCRC